MRVCLERKDYGEKQTTGKLFVYDDYGGLLAWVYTLELPWKNNQRRVSCIPEGEYLVKKHHSPKFKKSFWIQDVPARSEILIHAGNYYTQILGCVLPGLGFTDINGDGEKDVTQSRKAIDLLWSVLPDEFNLKIEKAMPEYFDENPENNGETQEGGSTEEQTQEEESNEDTEGPGGEIPEDDDEG